MAPLPPTARRAPKTTVQLGRTRTDDYAWMKDDNWKDVLRDPKLLRADIREHLEAENAYTAQMLAGTEALLRQVTAEMKGRVKVKLGQYGLFEQLTEDQFFPTVTSATKAYRHLTGVDWTPLR